MKKMFFDPIDQGGMLLHVAVGNHDCTYKNTNDLNSMSELFRGRDFIRIHTKPVTLELDRTKVLLIPWICTENESETDALLESTDAQVIFGHLQLAGFMMYRGQVCAEGLPIEKFQKFDAVYSGHLHHRHSRDNVHYLGSPYESTWHDYDDQRGFHIFDTETRAMEFVKNPFKMFEKIFYDDRSFPNLVEKLDYEAYRKKIVKVVVISKDDPESFDRMVDKLQEVDPHAVDVVDDHLNLDSQLTEDIIGESEDVDQIMDTYVEAVDAVTEIKRRLSLLMHKLRKEAVSQVGVE